VNVFFVFLGPDRAGQARKTKNTFTWPARGKQGESNEFGITASSFGKNACFARLFPKAQSPIQRTFKHRGNAAQNFS
jgi:hypothetical protein